MLKGWIIMIIKALRNLLIAVFVITAVYLWAWYESTSMSGQYYTEAFKKYTEGDYISALKGEQKVKEDKSGYYFSGGFQQVVQIWQHPLAYPKPEEYYLAAKKIDKIINEDMTVEMGDETFKRYFRQDNIYLGRILLKTGDIYSEQGELNKALDRYEMVKEIFTLDEELVSQADKRIEAQKDSLKSK